MAKTLRTEAIEGYRKEIDALESKENAEELFGKIEKSNEINDKDAQKLHVLLSTKVNEIKQADHDAKFASGDAEGAAEAIAKKVELDDDGNPVEVKKLKSPETIMADNRMARGMHQTKPITVPDGCKSQVVSVEELARIQSEDQELPVKKRVLLGARPVRPKNRGVAVSEYVVVLKKLLILAAILIGFQSTAMAAIANDDVAVFTDFSQSKGFVVNASGDLVPVSASTNDIGASANKVSNVYTDSLVLGAGVLDLGTVQTFADEDATPDVSAGIYFNTNTTTTTITDFDGTGIVDGQLIYIISKGAITYDVTTSGLIGGTTDLVTASGDLTVWIYDGTSWYLVQFTDQSDNLA